MINNKYKTLSEMVMASAQAMTAAGQRSQADRAALLCAIANEIEALGDILLQTASAESNLPIVRFQGERARTCGQLRMFAGYIEPGNHAEVNIDTAIPDRTPLPKPDIRSLLIGIGPIVVFGASNFPLAYSTAGGDTASALAAGCSVICKAHPAHLQTSSMVAEAIGRAIQQLDFPEDLFIHWSAADFEEVRQLVQHPGIKGVGFTGSLNGGMAIYEYARQRKEPIPVFAEMGSVNPVLLLPHALKVGAETWAESYAAAITMGVGQFCTNPGLLFGISSDELSAFSEVLAEKMAQSRDFKMLNESIHHNFVKRKDVVLGSAGVKALAHVAATSEATGTPVLATVQACDFVNQPTLHEEVFGPFSLLVECKDLDELAACLNVLGGQLTTTVIAEKEDEHTVTQLLPLLMRKAGRIIYNGVPTGVEVCDSMVHGGPFPATTDARFTAVGKHAIRRWLRPVAFQNWPPHLLPSDLRNTNENGAWRNINGRLTHNDVES